MVYSVMESAGSYFPLQNCRNTGPYIATGTVNLKKACDSDITNTPGNK